MDVEKVGQDDSQPFLSAFHYARNLDLVHSSRIMRTPSAIEDDCTNYKLAAMYLAWLDFKTE